MGAEIGQLMLYGIHYVNHKEVNLKEKVPKLD
jgi:hypothetical protein